MSIRWEGENRDKRMIFFMNTKKINIKYIMITTVKVYMGHTLLRYMFTYCLLVIFTFPNQTLRQILLAWSSA